MKPAYHEHILESYYIETAKLQCVFHFHALETKNSESNFKANGNQTTVSGT